MIMDAQQMTAYVIWSKLMKEQLKQFLATSH